MTYMYVQTLVYPLSATASAISNKTWVGNVCARRRSKATEGRREEVEEGEKKRKEEKGQRTASEFLCSMIQLLHHSLARYSSSHSNSDDSNTNTSCPLVGPNLTEQHSTVHITEGRQYGMMAREG